MFVSMHERIGLIAKEDSDRDEELGASCPSTLKIILKTGHVIEDVQLTDGENSFDEQTIDLTERTQMVPGGATGWTVDTASIAAIHQTFPSEEDRRAARAKSRAAA
jgi:hypothetical protein